LRRPAQSVASCSCRWEKQGPIFNGGGAGDFDSHGAAAHCVVRDFDSRRFFLFYEGINAEGRSCIGMAVSDDGKTGWRRFSEPVLSGGGGDAWDEGGVGAPCAVPMAGGKWRLYYAGKGVGAGWSGIGLALSAEGASFEGAPVDFKRRHGE
jgi:hypothetical protein